MKNAEVSQKYVEEIEKFYTFKKLYIEGYFHTKFNVSYKLTRAVEVFYQKKKRKLRYSIPRKSLRSDLHYCDFIYDKTCNENFIDTLELIQYNATLAIIGAIKGTSQQTFVGLEDVFSTSSA